MFSRFTQKFSVRVVGIGNHQGEFMHVAQNLLADALAGAVDADLHARTREQHSSTEHRPLGMLVEMLVEGVFLVSGIGLQ
jgi:hypothetical protein